MTPVDLYGFNDVPPFFTAGHVFTKAGPKAVDPEATLRENPSTHVSKLSVGNVLFKLDDKSGSQAYTEVRVASISSKSASCDFVYGLVAGTISTLPPSRNVILA